jgi:hypothetical protein
MVSRTSWLVKPCRRIILVNEPAPIDAAEVSAHQKFRIGKIEDLGNRGKPLLLCLIRCCREHLPRQLLLPAVAAIDPNLNEVGLWGARSCTALRTSATLVTA